MVLIRTIILKLTLTICSVSSGEIRLLVVDRNHGSSIDPVWLTENEPFYFFIESDVKLAHYIICWDGPEYYKLPLLISSEISPNFLYFSSDMTASEAMNGTKWTCFVYEAYNPHKYSWRWRFDVRLDVDECNASPSPCGPNANCTNTYGSYKCTCLSGTEDIGLYCQDVDECNASPSPCGPNANCTNTYGSYKCTCLSGYEDIGLYCQDVDECNASHDCSPDASCTNTPGGYECTCLPEHTGNGTYCQRQVSDEKHTWTLVLTIMVVLIVVAAVVWLMVDLYKRRQRQKKAIQLELNYESFENTTESSMPPPAQWDNYSLPVNRQNENATDTYNAPYQERNVEEMYAKPQPKSLRKLSNELLYAELNFTTIEQIGEKPTYGNLSNQTAEYSQIQIQPKLLATECPYSEVLPKSMRPNNETSKYVNVHDVQRFVNSDNGEASQDRSENAEPAYCEIGLKE